MILILCIRFACLLRSSPPANQLNMGIAVSAGAPLPETWRVLIPPACLAPETAASIPFSFSFCFCASSAFAVSFHRSNTDHLHIPSQTTVVTALEADQALPPPDPSNEPQFHSLGGIHVRVLLSLDTHGHQESLSIDCIEVHSPSGTNA